MFWLCNHIILAEINAILPLSLTHPFFAISLIEYELAIWSWVDYVYFEVDKYSTLILGSFVSISLF